MGCVWSASNWSIYKSIDTCKTFSDITSELIQSDVYAWPFALALGMNDDIFVMDEHGRIIKSIDKGQSFILSQEVFGNSDWYRKIAGSKNGIIVTSDRYSLDNGVSWNLNNVSLSFAYILDSTIYALSGDQNKIYKMDIISSVNNEQKIVSKLLISPNPTHHSASIEFTLDKTSNVTLAIFDALGNKVKQFDLGFKEQGTHNFNLDTYDLPQGLYFIKLQAGERVEMGKMLVIQ